MGAACPRWVHRRRSLVMALLVTLAPTIAAGARQTGVPSTPPPTLAFDLEIVADGLDRPVQVVDPGDGSGRLFVVEQPGRIRIVRAGRLLPTPFLDIADRIECCGERGLLGLAFHPDYSVNGLFYLGYTAANPTNGGLGDNTVARYRVSPDDPDRADPASGEVLLAVPDPAGNHNGGLVLFGPDGYLYVGLGDGGGGNGQNGQDLGTPHGKILRIDGDRAANGRPYAIPPDNPFVGRPEARPEIWVLGLRNPWRFSFDRATGDLWVGDVGSAIFEEINRQPGDSAGGENFGWNLMEGTECRSDAGCDAFVPPVSGFDRRDGSVVTGGYVYRGAALPDLVGTYLFADYPSGRVWGLTPADSGAWTRSAPVETGLRISSFGEDAAGELYLVDLNGTVSRLVAPRR